MGCGCNKKTTPKVSVKRTTTVTKTDSTPKTSKK